MARPPALRHESNLPLYAVKRSNDWPDWSLVTCPREGCEGTFLVLTKAWKRDNGYIGRSCPYCFKVGRIPRRGQSK